MIHMPITVNSIGGVHNAFTETGGNGQIQNQLITPATALIRAAAVVGPVARRVVRGP
jgi:hypothetical protein